ncbi:hypothetical protein SK128_006826, partial [Halocaridina rubra]
TTVSSSEGFIAYFYENGKPAVDTASSYAQARELACTQLSCNSNHKKKDSLPVLAAQEFIRLL